MPYIPNEIVEKAKQVDLLSYLFSCEPGNLIDLGNGRYCTRDHDSLKISNGKWYWFSKGVGGRSALSYLMNVKDLSFKSLWILVITFAQMIPAGFFLL